MEKECCQIKVTKIENGCRIEITGENIKDGNCCQMLKSFCDTQKKTDDKGCCC